MGEVGFEPTNSLRGQIYSLLPLTARPFARQKVKKCNFYKKQIFYHHSGMTWQNSLAFGVKT